MSEKTFRVILVAVVVIWVIFVLVPSLADFMPRAWANVQYFLPGDLPRVTVVVKDARSGEGVDQARVQIVTGSSTLAAVTGKDGQAEFESVPAGRAQVVRVQKLDYDTEILSETNIPHRQRARFNFVLRSDMGRRLYIGHEASATGTGMSVLDLASHLALIPPGSGNILENVVDMKASASSQRLYVLENDRLLILSMNDVSLLVKELPLQAPAGGLAIDATLDPSGESLYVFGGQWLTAISARTWATRYSIEITSAARRAVVIVSPDGRRVYLAPIGDQTVSVYDAQAGRRLAVYALGDTITDATLARDGRMLYVLTDRRQIPVGINTVTNATTPVLDSVADNTLSGATRIVYSEFQAGTWLCLLQATAQQVAIIDLNARTVRRVAVGKEPTGLLAVPFSDELYVTDKGSNTLSLVSLSKGALIDTIDVRSKPVYLALP